MKRLAMLMAVASMMACGGPTEEQCVPATCGSACGVVEDGCGGTLNCGACTSCNQFITECGVSYKSCTDGNTDWLEHGGNQYDCASSNCWAEQQAVTQTCANFLNRNVCAFDGISTRYAFCNGGHSCVYGGNCVQALGYCCSN
jgi:hypothetical protein